MNGAGVCHRRSEQVQGLIHDLPGRIIESEQELKNIVINEVHVVTITQEQYVEVQGKIEAVTSRTTLTCPTSLGACVGAEDTYVWRPDANNCDVQKVRKITSFFNKAGMWIQIQFATLDPGWQILYNKHLCAVFTASNDYLIIFSPFFQPVLQFYQ